ncbi:MAG: putative T7SS-secreted protein, partial [Pseudonocardiaceae bacterium]
MREYEQAKKDSEQACDTYNSQVRTYNSQVISYNTTAQSGGDPGPIPQPPGEFHDPGLAGVQQAKDTLD